jgi:hypothetical protein
MGYYIASPFLTSALDRGEWSVSRPGRFTPGERASGPHWIGGCVGTRTSPDAVKMGTISCPCRKMNLRRPACSPSLYPAPDIYRSRDSSVGIATGYGLDDRGVGVRVPVGSRIFSSPRLPDRLWGPPNRGGGLFPRGVKLTTHLQLVPRSRKRGSIHPLPHTPS